jgi:zinc protease
MSPLRLARPAAVLAVLALALGAHPASAAPPRFQPPRPIETTLDNGLRVVVFEDARLPIVQVQVLVPAGVTAERENESGLAHFTGQMLKRGTPERDAARFSNDMAALGAELVATTNRDFVTIGAGFLKEDFEKGMGLVADVVVRPLFSNEEIGRAHFDVARTLIDLHLNIVSTAEEQIWPLVLGFHPYGRPPAGTVATVLQINRDQLVEFHQRHYRPRGSVLAVAGDVRAADVFEAARVVFGEWSGAAVSIPSIVLSETTVRPRIRIVDLATDARTELRLATPAPERGSASYLPFAIANRAFSEIPGARLQRDARGSGIVGGLSSSQASLRDGGLWIVRAVARTDSAGAAIAALRRVVEEFQSNPPGPDEVEAAQRLHRAAHPMEFSTLARMLGAWSEADAYGLGQEILSGEALGLDSLDAGAVAAALRRYADPARLNILAVGPAERLRPQLEALGEVEVVRLQGLPDTPWASRENAAEDVARGTAIVDAAAGALGGRAKIREIKDSTVNADVTYVEQGREVSGRMRLLRKDPLMFREEVDTFVFRNEHVLNGAYGWLYDSRNEDIVPADSVHLATLRSSFLSDVPHLMRQAMDDSATAIYRGQEQVNGRVADVVEVQLRGQARQIWLLFDATTHMLVASDVRGGVPPQVLARRTYSDYRDVGGVKLPYVEERHVQNIRIMRIEAFEVAINSGLANSAFGIPRTAR